MSTTPQNSLSPQPGACAASPAKVAIRSILKGCSASEPMQKRPIILLVEGDADAAELLGRLLPRWGFDVRSASSLAEARSAIAAGPFDLLLSDLVLPDGNGADLCRQLQLDHHVPAISVTGHASPDETARCKAAGFDRCLTKPLDMDLLFCAIQKTLGMECGADFGEQSSDAGRMPGKSL